MATTTGTTSDDDTTTNKPALVFGASGEQGQHVIHGLLKSKYTTNKIYGATRKLSHVPQTSSSLTTQAVKDGKVQFLEVDLNDPVSIEQTLLKTNAGSIFLVTTTDLPPSDSAVISLKEAEEREYESITSFFNILVKIYKKDHMSRHVVFSTLDNVKGINDDATKSGSGGPFIKPLDDGSVVPHYSGKGRAGQYGLDLLEPIPDLTLTLLTLPLLHGNFMASTIPLPDEGQTTWTISACFGDNTIDMMSVSDLAYIVPSIFENRVLYDGYNLRVSAEKITLDEVARTFADLFGKDVIYNPLTVEEMASLPIPHAPAFAQMCQFLSDERSSHDVDVTETVMFPRKPQLFKDWLLTHSDDSAFEKVGLSLDGTPITSVTVFGATGMQGKSVVKGLLNDKRKEYQIRATTRHVNSSKAKSIKALDPNRVTLIEADFDNIHSCRKAVDGVDGAFLVTDFESANMDLEVEERHAKNVIDACEQSHTVRHLVFSTLESVTDMNRELKLGLTEMEDNVGNKSILPQFDAKARAAAYARTKKISVTYVLMPVYSESFLELMKPDVTVNAETGQETHSFAIPAANDKKEGDVALMCMSVDELGPAVANIFDSYQVYAGHEIGLVTDFVTVSEAAEMIEDVFYSDNTTKQKDGAGEESSETRAATTTATKVEKREVDTDTWIEKRDTVAKDLGQMFRYYSKTDAVKKRYSVATTLQLVPDAKPLRQWLEENRDNVEFRQRLGLR